MDRLSRAALVLLLTVVLPSPTRAQTPLGSAFLYQGRLDVSGEPATSNHDFSFDLYAVASDGAPLGNVLRPNVTVSGGLFTVSLDFGASVFGGSARWLEIGVRPAGSGAPYTVLSPRQELSPVPNALFSSATPWAGVSGTPVGFADGVDDNSGGTVTSVGAGSGLIGGPITTSGTLSVDSTVVRQDGLGNVMVAGNYRYSSNRTHHRPVSGIELRPALFDLGVPKIPTTPAAATCTTARHCRRAAETT